MTEYSEVIPTRPGHYVYRCWAADGTCLYVGRCGEVGPRRLTKRLGEHRYDKPWWPQVTRVDAAAFAGAAEIIDEEPRQVAALKPVHNRQLRPVCINGHDLTGPNGRTEHGQCRECHRSHNLNYSRKPQNKARDAARHARASLRLRGPAPGQQGLW